MDCDTFETRPKAEPSVEYSSAKSHSPSQGQLPKEQSNWPDLRVPDDRDQSYSVNDATSVSRHEYCQRGEGVRAPGVDIAGADRVHPDVLRAELAGHAPRHLEHGGLGRVVGYPGMALETLIGVPRHVKKQPADSPGSRRCR